MILLLQSSMAHDIHPSPGMMPTYFLHWLQFVYNRFKASFSYMFLTITLHNVILFYSLCKFFPVSSPFLLFSCLCLFTTPRVVIFFCLLLLWLLHTSPPLSFSFSTPSSFKSSFISMSPLSSDTFFTNVLTPSVTVCLFSLSFKTVFFHLCCATVTFLCSSLVISWLFSLTISVNSNKKLSST